MLRVRSPRLFGTSQQIYMGLPVALARGTPFRSRLLARCCGQPAKLPFDSGLEDLAGPISSSQAVHEKRGRASDLKLETLADFAANQFQGLRVARREVADATDSRGSFAHAFRGERRLIGKQPILH